MICLILLGSLSNVFAANYNNAAYKFNGSVGYNYDTVSNSYTASKYATAANSRFSVNYKGSSSGESFKAWFRIYNVREYYSGTSHILPQKGSFTNQTANVQYRIGYPYVLQASREHIINPSRNVNGTWGFGPA